MENELYFLECYKQRKLDDIIGVSEKKRYFNGVKNYVDAL